MKTISKPCQFYGLKQKSFSIVKCYAIILIIYKKYSSGILGKTRRFGTLSKNVV